MSICIFLNAVAKKLNYDFSGVDKSGKIWGLRYGDFVVPLVKAVQELSQQNDDLKKQNDALKSRLDKIEAALALQTQNVELGKNAKLEQNVPNPIVPPLQSVITCQTRIMYTSIFMHQTERS